MVNHHYIDKVPLNVLVAAPRKQVGRARKRSMTPSELTYLDLKKLLQNQAALGANLSPASLANLISALNGFMREREIQENSPIGSSLRASYYKNLNSHVEQLKSEGRSAAYIANRKSLLSNWRRCVIEHDRYCALSLKQASPFQRALLDIFDAGVTKTNVCRATNISKATLARWCDGRAPNRASLHYVGRIEKFLGLTAGALTDLLSIRVTPTEDSGKGSRIAYRERQKELSKDLYAIKNPTDSLRKEWADFLQYKVSELDLDDEETLKRSSGGRWRSTGSTTVKPRPSNWATWHRGRRVPAAGVTWTNVSQFLGWLTLPAERGGQGLPVEAAHTLAHFANRRWVREFTEWKRQRAGGIAHQGLLSFLRFVSSICNPRTGYLTQRCQAFGAPAGFAPEEWRGRCIKTFESVARLRAELADDAKPSRDSKEPLRSVLALQNPLEAIADMVTRMGAARPLSGGKREAIWARDLLLIKLTASNPLREKNIRELTYRVDNTGHLRRSEDGGWYIFVHRQELKNQNGAAKDRDYQMCVRREVWPDIEQYLSQYRPMLLQTTTDVLFVTERLGAPFSEDALGQRFYTLTKKYLHDCPGVGPHAFRHIVATSILKANPNDWATAAWALHDDEKTVQKHYAHLAQHDAARWMGRAMDGPFGRMR